MYASIAIGRVAAYWHTLGPHAQNEKNAPA